MLHTNEDFVRIKEQLAANNPAVVAGYENLKSNEWSQSTVNTYPVETIKRGISGDENYINAARGAHAAYLNALRWKISGDAAHANKAVQILNSWANVTTGLGGNTNVSLASGLYGYEFANAAELMRDYSGWKASDFQKFQRWMLSVWYPYCYDFLTRRHDTWSAGTPGHYWSNWGLCNTLAVMSIGILCDDEFIYNQGVAFYKYDKVGTFKEDPSLAYVDNWGLTEYIGNLVPVVHPDERGVYGVLGQMQESGRDQGHATMALGLAVDICQTAWNQGDDLFGYMDNRLLAGIEYLAAYNSGTDDLPWTNYWYHDVRTTLANSWKQTFNNEGGRGQFRPYWDRILGHYEGVKGLSLNYAHAMANRVVADGGAYGSTSGGYDHLGFTTLTCTNAPIEKNQAPMTISTQIEYNSKTYNQGEISKVTKGSTVRLIPVLPDTVTDSGNWLWSNGNTTKTLEITADSSAIYRVSYTDQNGVKSTQMFSIAVYGDCVADVYFPYLYYDGKTYETTNLTVTPYSKVKLELKSGSWHSTYQWANGSTNNAIEVQVLNKDTVVTVEATNLGGKTISKSFSITTSVIAPAYRVNQGELIYSQNVSIQYGQTLELIPSVKEGYEGGNWYWSVNGITTQHLTIENIQSGKNIGAVYTLNGEKYYLAYFIHIIPYLEDCIGYWPFIENEGTVVHDVWKSNDASIAAGSWTNGYYGKGYQLNGASNSFIDLPDNLWSSVNDFTVSIWVKLNALEAWARIWDFGTGEAYNMFLTASAASNNSPFRFAIKAGGGEQQINTSEVLPIGKWSHIVVSKKDNLGTLYLNGVEVGRNEAMTLAPNDLGVSTQNYIGKSQYNDPLLKGTVDEIRMFNRALEANEVLDLMHLENPNVPHHLTATNIDGNAQLKWSATVGAESYVLLRSNQSGGPYHEIASGISTNTYVDTTVIPGTYFYVVKAITKGFEGELSDEVELKIWPEKANAFNRSNLKIYPNPFNDLLYLESESHLLNSALKFYNSSGQLCLSTIISDNEMSLDLANLPSGIYYLEIKNQHRVMNQKLIKTR